MSIVSAADLSLATLLAEVRRRIDDPRVGLPLDVFYFVTQLTPMVNVDLLIHNDSGQTLLTWREDPFYGPGWHVPGGIVRFKELAAERIAAVARTELGSGVAAQPDPISIREIVSPHRDVRGHFISLLYRCRLRTPPAPHLCWGGAAPAHGQWHWFERAPENLIQVHDIYRPYINNPATPGEPVAASLA